MERERLKKELLRQYESGLIQMQNGPAPPRPGPPGPPYGAAPPPNAFPPPSGGGMFPSSDNNAFYPPPNEPPPTLFGAPIPPAASGPRSSVSTPPEMGGGLMENILKAMETPEMRNMLMKMIQRGGNMGERGIKPIHAGIKVQLDFLH